MNTVLGISLIALGSIGHAASYKPVNKVTTWSWESYWFVQGLFAWLVFPFIGSILAIPSGGSLLQLYADNSSVIPNAVLLGAGWGVGGLIFVLSIRYLGVAIGQSIALGTCSAFATLLPAVMMGNKLFSGNGLILLTSVSIGIAGIFVIGYALSLKSKSMSAYERRKATRNFSYGQGFFIAILAGLMSACFGLGLVATESIRLDLLLKGGDRLLAGLPSILIVTIGGFLVNSGYSIYRNLSNKTGFDYFRVPMSTFFYNLFFSALAGFLWYSQFVGLVLGESFFDDNSLMFSFSWSILMALNVVFSTLLAIFLKEWKGLNSKTIFVLSLGMIILVFSVFFPSLF